MEITSKIHYCSFIKLLNNIYKLVNAFSVLIIVKPMHTKIFVNLYGTDSSI